MKHFFYRRYGKRIFDCCFALSVLMVLWPLLLGLAGLIRVILGSGVVFGQRRPGLDEKIFTIFKFRTMTNERDENGDLLPDERRLRPLGAFLRKSSLDELPELINILRGEMSLVGPRPLLPEYLPYYTNRERLRHSVRPGITGLAQVSGRNYLPWDERLEVDVRYVEKLSFALDVKIILRTVAQVIRAKNVAVVPEKASPYLSQYRENKKLIEVEKGEG